MKRQRPQSPLALAMVSSPCSSTVAETHNSGGLDPTASDEFAMRNEEEEMDMANCLILLAQGNTKKISSSALPMAVGLYVHRCKTCNRCFPSFQALGGHRASHKKPKVNNTNITEANKQATFVKMEEENDRSNNKSTTLSLQIENRGLKANKVHECSICGAEFSSGQALGGHMRRHRNFMPTTSSRSLHDQSQQAKKSRNVQQLDLNLPAPEDDRQEFRFAFPSKEQVIVFSSSPLVDCYY